MLAFDVASLHIFPEIASMKSILKVGVLGLAHGLNDCIAGFMIGLLAHSETAVSTGALVILYNVLAFGGQVPAGLVVDRLGKPKLALMVSLGLATAAIGVFPFAPVMAIALAGVGGAFFHVSGGMLALLAFPGSTVGAGLFAAPGVMGLAFGGYLAWWVEGAAQPWLLGAVLGVALLTLLLRFPQGRAVLMAEEGHADLGWHDLLMLILLLAIAMRSAVWNVFQLIHHGEHALLLGLAAAAMAGKVLGGFAAQWFGWRNYALGALSVATPLLLLADAQPALLYPGILLLQSATPAAVLGMWRLMPRLPATAVGMCFGLAIAAGGIPMLMGWEPPVWSVAVLVPLAAVGYAIAVRNRVRDVQQ
jgi:MFS transporter, FSR family, fosmidomycin resistance protein